ncbi:MAG: hypothetical protein D6689_22480, partial [Deltaproteobacteria bacterium]
MHHALTPTYELFFVLESFQACLGEYVAALRPLDGRIDHGLLGCDAYYREDTDVALLALRFDERVLDADRLGWILDFATGAGLAALDPTRLSDDDRRRFYRHYLNEYPLRAEGHPRPDDALGALATALGIRVPRPRALTGNVVRTPAPEREPMPAAAGAPRTGAAARAPNAPPAPARPGSRMGTEATRTWRPGSGRPRPPGAEAAGAPATPLADQPTEPTRRPDGAAGGTRAAARRPPPIPRAPGAPARYPRA